MDYDGEERRKATNCPLTSEELRRICDNQDKLVEQMAVIQKYLFAGDRDAIRQATMIQALQNLLQLMSTA